MISDGATPGRGRGSANDLPERWNTKETTTKNNVFSLGPYAFGIYTGMFGQQKLSYTIRLVLLPQ